MQALEVTKFEAQRSADEMHLAGYLD